MRIARFHVCLLLLAAIFSAGCGDKKAPGGAESTNASSSGSPLTAPVDYLGAVGKAQQTAIKTIDTAQINHAIEMYRVEQGKNPPTLQDLVAEKYLSRLPDLPFGMKYSYDPATGIVKAVKE